MDDENYQKFFRLQEDEKIVEAIKPLPALKWLFFIHGIIGWFIVIFFGIWIALPLLLFAGGISGFVIGGILSLLLAFVGPYVFASLSYGKRFYWITSKRVIGKSGLIGYQVNSIPLERISDVIISRSLLEQIFGFGSLHIQSLAGQVSYPGKFGAEGDFQAVPDPEGLQKKIFELIKEKRKKESITM